MDSFNWINDALGRKSAGFFDQLADGLLWLDEAGRIAGCTTSLAVLAGSDRERLIGERVDTLLPLMNATAYRHWWKTTREEGRTSREAILATGGDQHLPVKLTAVWWARPEAPAMCCLLDELAVGEQELELVRATMAQIKVGAWYWDLITGLFLVTDEFYELFELEPQGKALLRKNLLHLLKDRLSNDQVSRLTTQIAEVRREKSPAAFTLQLPVGETKRRFQVHIEPILENEQVSAIRGFFSQERAAGAMRQFEALAYQSLNRSDEMIFWVEPDCSFRFVNEEACRQLQYETEALLQQTVLDVDKEHDQANWEHFWAVLAERKTLQVESLFQRRNGTVFPVEIHLIYLDGEGETLICLLASDITERRQKEARLQGALVEIKSLSRQMEAENVYLKEEISSHYNFNNILTKSPRYRELLEQARQVAATDATVLILGETGTGKELLARAIHSVSERRERSLIKVNCAALSKTLIESELFGHEKGAFTGADKRKEGRFELADGGTIFLDEIGEVPLELQAKLLRVLQEGEFERLGGTQTLRVDVRIIAATNRRLEEMMEQGAFRSDLYYRLNVFPLQNIPLRERKEDIPLLVEHFLDRYCEKVGKDIDRIAAKDLERLQRYDFPGNIRELENIIERAVVLNRGKVLKLRNWNSASPNSARREKEEDQELVSFEEAQRRHILRALEKTHWRVSGDRGAAEILGLNPQTLYSKMRRLGIKRKA